MPRDQLVDEPVERVKAMRRKPGIDVERAMRALVNATTPEQVVEIANQAEALRLYAKRSKLGLDAQNRCATVRLRAERKLGDMLAKTNLHQGGRPAKTPDRAEGVSRPTLQSLGLSWKQSHQAQRIASVPAAEFEDYVKHAARASIEITTADLLRMAVLNDVDVSPCGRLLKQIEALAPVLSREGPIKFDGRHAVACAKGVFIEVACDLPLDDAVPGGALIRLLKHDSSRELEPTVEDGRLILRGPKTTVKLARAADPVIFAPPRLVSGAATTFTGDFARQLVDGAVEKAQFLLRCQPPWLSFLCVRPDVASLARLRCPDGLKPRAVELPERFLQSLSHVCGDGGQLFIGEPDGEWRERCGAVIEAVAPNGARVVAPCLKVLKAEDGEVDDLVKKLPQGTLPISLARAFLPGGINSADNIRIEIIGAHFATAVTSVLGERWLNGELKHEPVVATFPARPLLKGLEKNFAKFGVSAKCFAMYSEDESVGYFIAALAAMEMEGGGR